MVDEMIPPMTTVANGLCTSAPAPVAIAIGMKPRDATECGHQDRPQPSERAFLDRFDERMTLVAQLFDESG